MVESTAQFVVTVVMILLNYMINVMDSLGTLLQYVPLSIPSVEEMSSIRTAGTSAEWICPRRESLIFQRLRIFWRVEERFESQHASDRTLHFKVLIGIVEIFSAAVIWGGVG